MTFFRNDEAPTLTNWLGQEIRVGSWVYRGGRDGNTSSFKVGQVTKLHDNGKVTVQYHAEKEHHARFGKFGTGIPSVDSVVLIDTTTFTPDVLAAMNE